MAGFLDKNDRIVDMVLTNEGKKLLSKGNLRFAYFTLFDDEVDYSPVISNSGTLTPEQLSGTIYAQIEATLVRESSTGYQNMNKSGSDFVNVIRPLFSMPQGQQYLPRVSASNEPANPATIQVKHRKLQDVHVQLDQKGNTVNTLGPYDRGYERFDTSNVTFDLFVRDFNVDTSHKEGFLIRVYSTGTEGLVEVKDRRDLQNDISYNNDVKLFVIGGSKKNAG